MYHATVHIPMETHKTFDFPGGMSGPPVHPSGTAHADPDSMTAQTHCFLAFNSCLSLAGPTVAQLEVFFSSDYL